MITVYADCPNCNRKKIMSQRRVDENGMLKIKETCVVCGFINFKDIDSNPVSYKNKMQTDVMEA